MAELLTHETLAPLLDRLRDDDAAHAAGFPGDPVDRQPVHVVYGGAHLFKASTPARLGALALNSIRTFSSGPEDFAAALNIAPALAGPVYSRVIAKLESEPVEDYRLDFEDGYGYRSDAEEDAVAVSAAKQLAAAMKEPLFPPFCGFRVKALSRQARARSIRTFQLFLGSLLDATGGQLPSGFVVTLPKVASPEQVAVFGDLFEQFEARNGLPAGSLRMELMIETVRAIVDREGRFALPELIRAARGRCRGAHLGAYDFSAECNITSQHQSISHPACDFARQVMQVCLGGRGVTLSDSVTSTMPVAIHRGEHLTPGQKDENRRSVRHAWKIHFDDARRSLRNGFYQGWDLHPGQLPTRYAAVYSFFLEELSTASARLRNFVEKAAQATVVGSAFDDAATGQGLLNFFLRGLACGAISESEAMQTGLSIEELRGKSFAAITASRAKDGRIGA
jgi:citrate lyase beta subunit